MASNPQTSLSADTCLRRAFDDTNSSLTTQPFNWTVYHAPGTTTQATCTKTAASGLRHVCNSITATLAAASTAQTPINVYLRDGASGSGTIIWAGSIAAPANGLSSITVSGLHIVGSTNTAMTLEFSAAGVTGSLEAVTLSGYEVV